MNMEKLSGREIGKRMSDAVHAHVEHALSPFSERLDSLQTIAERAATIDMIRGVCDAVVSEMRDAMKAELLEAIAPKVLEHCERLAKQCAVSMEAITPIIDAAQARSALELERSAQERVQRGVDAGIQIAVAKMRQPEDGRGIEDIRFSLDGRELVVETRIGGESTQQRIKLDIPIYRDVHRSGHTYEKGDIVTYGGSWWIALDDIGQEDYPSKSPKWRLCVKQGRPGKDAQA